MSMSRPEYPIFDGHNDTLLSLHLDQGDGGRSFFVESKRGHIDLPRARRGGLAGGFFAVFVPPVNAAGGRTVRRADEKGGQDGQTSRRAGGQADEKTRRFDRPRPSSTATGSTIAALDPAYALRFTEEVVAGLRRLINDANGQVRLVPTVNNLTQCIELDVLAVVLHFEGAEAIYPDLDTLNRFYQQGLRSLGIVWSRPNAYGHGVTFEFPGSPDSGPGLTEAGVRLVERCNHLGIVIDLAHITERGFWDAAEHTTAPLVVTHGAVHALCPSPRNLTDRQLDAVGETNGVVGINFHVGFLREDGAREPDTPLSVLVRHIDYAVQRIGIDHVAMGSDFDGAMMPRQIGDAAGLPILIDELQRSGYDGDALRKLTHQNWIRVLGETWK